MFPTRSIMVVAAAALGLVAGCGGSGTGASAPTTSPSASPTPTGNGIASLPPAQILARAKTALLAAPSVHLTGNVTSGGQQLMLDLSSSGKDGGRGTISQSGQTIEVLRIGSTVYIKADADFWRAQTGNANAAQLLQGKYLKAPVSDPKMASIAELTQIDKYVSGLLSPTGTLTKGQQKTIRGTEAIAVVISGKGGGTLYVATNGQPYPLQITSSDPTEPGTIDFVEYGQPVALTPPPAEQVIDTSKLGTR
jgi:hypothetical protein